MKRPHWLSRANEALREKVSLLGEFQDILLKFHIFKIKFLHEKIIIFGLDFFLTKLWLGSVQISQTSDAGLAQPSSKFWKML